jgi:hypothetical protein
VQGLAEAERGDKPIEPRFGPGRGGRVVAYYCRKEYRAGLAGMIGTLHDKLQNAYDPSHNLRSEQPPFRPVIAAGTSAAFVDWLAQWREFAACYRLAEPGAPLLVAIDGLDEADPPPDSTPLQVLPRPEALPAGIYLVLTSRPVGDLDTPAFLATHVEPLYSRIMGPKNAEYISSRGIFRVLNRVEIHLPGKWWWHGEDIEDTTAQGVIFRAYREHGGLDVAYLIVVDVTSDPTEPDISLLKHEDVAGLDRVLEAFIRQDMANQGSELVRWMSSQLNEADSQRGLVTAYIRKDSGKERQIIALRMTINSRKMILMGCFDVADADSLASEIFNAMGQVTILPPSTPLGKPSSN